MSDHGTNRGDGVPDTALYQNPTGLGARVNPVWLLVSLPVFSFAQDIEEDIRGARDLIEIPEPPNYGFWIGIAIAVLILFYLIWKLVTRNRPSPSVSFSSEALSKLDACRVLLFEESAEPLANSVTGIVRTYLEKRFGIAAPKRTTEEFLSGLQADSSPELDPYREDLSRFLRNCDAVKYGRGTMRVETRETLIESARRFIESTRRKAETA